MPLQSEMGALQAPLSKLGHAPIAPQPIPSNGSSSDVPHVLSAPPQSFAIERARLSVAFWMLDAVFGSAWQSVTDTSRPVTFLFSQPCRAFAFVCANFAEASAIPRSHLIGSASARLAPMRRIATKVH